MSYTTYDKMVVIYPAIKNAGKTPTELNSAFIHRAERELDSRLAPSYTVPFTPTPPIIQDLAEQLTWVRLFRAQGNYEKADSLEESFDKRIKALLDGDAMIVTDSGTTIDTDGFNNDIWSNTMDFLNTMTMLNPESEFSRVDSALLCDLEDERS
jgi:hypothetical protein